MIFDEVKGKLGFGLMRLPKNGEDIDIEQVKKMVDKFIDAGLTYFDTAFVYPGSEEAIRQALVERYPRESFQLATKNACWINPGDKDAAHDMLNKSLKNTGAGYIDYYLLHNLGANRSKYFEEFGMWDWIIEQKKAGLVKHIGFSAHADPKEVDDILTKHPEMEFIQLQINYADWEDPVNQAGACYEVARKHNKPIIVMEPVKGGNLAMLPSEVDKILKDADPNVSAASWAIRFAASLDGVEVVLSGMSNMEQMEDNLSYMKDFKPMDNAEKETIEKARKALAKIPSIPCTSCDYCAKVCPKNIAISSSFYCMNLVKVYNNKPFAISQESYLTTGAGKERASACIKCGKCEEVCPQNIKIRDELETITKELINT